MGEEGNRISLSLGLLVHFSLYVFQLRSVWELDKVKELMLEELWLQGNPLCVTFPNHAAYVRSVVIPVTFLGTFLVPGRLSCP